MNMLFLTSASLRLIFISFAPLRAPDYFACIVYRSGIVYRFKDFAPRHSRSLLYFIFFIINFNEMIQYKSHTYRRGGTQCAAKAERCAFLFEKRAK